MEWHHTAYVTRTAPYCMYVVYTVHFTPHYCTCIETMTAAVLKRVQITFSFLYNSAVNVEVLFMHFLDTFIGDNLFSLLGTIFLSGEVESFKWLTYGATARTRIDSLTSAMQCLDCYESGECFCSVCNDLLKSSSSDMYGSVLNFDNGIHHLGLQF